MRSARRMPTGFAIALTLICLRGVIAQESLGPPPLPTPGDLERAPRELSIPDQPPSLPPSLTQDAAGGMGSAGEVGASGVMLFDPADVWSSGTYLERGFWYAEEEAVILVREFAKRNTLLALDNSGSQRTLQVRTRHPAAMANARITLGRFLFRDRNNWDHNFEATFFGLGREDQSSSVASLLSNGLIVPSGEQISLFDFLNNLDLNNNSFDGSNRQSYSYRHRFNSLEFNYRAKQRMRRDKMVLNPSGQWARAASPTRTQEYIAGLRWFNTDEWMVWDAEASPASNGTSGNMRIATRNDLVGGQLGAAMGQKWDRFSVNFTGKGGVFVNFARVNRSFIVVNEPAVGAPSLLASSRQRAEEEAMAFIGSFQGLARYHILPNLSFRLAYEMMYVDSVAVAPFQITFTPAFNVVGLSAGNFYQGVSFGIEGYW